MEADVNRYHRNHLVSLIHYIIIDLAVSYFQYIKVIGGNILCTKKIISCFLILLQQGPQNFDNKGCFVYENW